MLTPDTSNHDILECCDSMHECGVRDLRLRYGAES